MFTRLGERSSAVCAIALALASLAAHPHPTGSSSVDRPLVVVAFALAAWASAAAPWWAVTVTAAVATGISVNSPAAVAGVLAIAFGLWSGATRHDVPVVHTVIVGVALNVSLWSHLDTPFGLGAALMVPCTAVLVVLGISRRSGRLRAVTWWVAGGLCGLLLLITGVAALSVLKAKTALQDGERMARRGIDALKDGEIDLATQRFDAAAQQMNHARDLLTSGWMSPARLVPVLAQHRDTLVVVSKNGSQLLHVAVDSLHSVNPDDLKIKDGTIDLVALADAEAPLRTLQSEITKVSSALHATESGWLLAPLNDRLSSLLTEIDDNSKNLDTAVEAVAAAPRLLGADGARHYLILLTTPAEARGVGGFPGNYATLTVDHGTLTLEHFGRIEELDKAAMDNNAFCTGCPEDFLARYGRFGFDNGPGGSIGSEPWRTITMPADFPTVAKVAQILYAQGGLGHLDGVAVMDTYVLSRLAKYTGQIDVPQTDVSLEGDEFLPYLLFEQYFADDKADRVDALDTLGKTVIDRLLAGKLPAPAKLVSDLLPLVDDRRLLFWTENADEQVVLDRVGILGALPTVDPAVDAGFGFTFNNAGAGKIDAFLRTEQHLTIDLPNHTLIAEVTLENTAPDHGLPRYLIGNQVGLPDGTNRHLITFYSAREPQNATINGKPLGLEFTTEAGWVASSNYGVLPSGATAVYRIEIPLPVGITSVQQLKLWSQSLVASRDDLGPKAVNAVPGR